MATNTVGDIKKPWELLSATSATTDPAIDDDDLHLTARPSGISGANYPEDAQLTLIAYSTAAEDAAFTVNLWGFRRGSKIAEYIGELTLTVGSSELTMDPLDGSTIDARFVDTIAVDDKWSDAQVSRVAVGGDSGNDRIASLRIDLDGLAYVFAERTAGTGTLTILKTSLNR